MATNLKRVFKFGNREFSISFILSVLGSVLGMIFSVLAARFLEAERYGEIHYYISIISLLSTLMLFGIDQYIIKNIQFCEDKKTFIGKAYILLFLIGSFVLPIYFKIGTELLTKLNGDTTLVLVIFFLSLLLCITNIIYAFFQGINHYERKLLFSSLLPHLLFLITLLIHYFTNTLDTFMDLYLLYYAIYYGGFGLIFFFKYFRLKASSLMFSRSELISILFIGLSYVLYNIQSPISNIIIGESYETFGVSGIYSISSQILTVAGLASGVASSISQTTISKLANEDNVEKIVSFYESYTRIAIYIAAPFYIAFIVEAQNLMAFFGESYLGHNAIIVLLSISSLINQVTGPCGTLLLLGGQEKRNFIASIVTLCTFLLIVAVLINYTIYAAPIASVISGIVGNGLKLFFLHKRYKRFFMSWRIVVPFIVICLICSGAFFLVSLISNTIIWLIVNCVVGLGIIIGCIALTPFKQDKKFFTRNKEME